MSLLSHLPRGTYPRADLPAGHIIIEIADSEFIVRKDSLTEISNYFNRAIYGGFREAHSNIIQLDEQDVNVEILEIFLIWASFPHPMPNFNDWLYTLNISLEDLIEMYILSDYFDSFSFRSQVHGAIVNQCFGRLYPIVPTVETIERAVTAVPRHLPLRALMFRAVANADADVMVEILSQVIHFDPGFCSNVIEARDLCQRLGSTLQAELLPQPR